MTETIYKYPLKIDDTQTVTLPKGSRLLTVQAQRGEPRLWAVVDPSSEETEERVIHTVGTGHPIPSEAFHYLGTVQLHGGDLVFHYFEG